MNDLDSALGPGHARNGDLDSLRDRLDRSLLADPEFARQARARDSIAASATDSLPRDGDVLLLGAGGSAASRVADARASDRRVVALEFGDAAMRRAMTECTATGVTWGDALASSRPPFEGPFSAALGVEFLALVPRPEDHVSSILAALSPGGPFRFITDFYAENTAVHGWRRRFDLPYRLLSTRGWIALFENAGFEEVKVARIFVRGDDDWRSRRGSFVVSGIRPNR